MLLYIRYLQLLPRIPAFFFRRNTSISGPFPLADAPIMAEARFLQKYYMPVSGTFSLSQSRNTIKNRSAWTFT